MRAFARMVMSGSWTRGDALANVGQFLGRDTS
jgi:hypothetical protein